MTLKQDVSFISSSATLRQVLEIMRHSGYSAVPMIDENGKYTGTLTEGDLLWHLLGQDLAKPKALECSHVSEVSRQRDYTAVRASSDMEDLIGKAKNQNFVPVVDDQENFIGIITRKRILEYYYQEMERLRKTCGGKEDPEDITFPILHAGQAQEKK